MVNQYKEKFKRASKGKASIFIDVANLERSVQSMWVNPKDISDEFGGEMAEDLCWRVDYKKLKKFFENECDLQKIYFYSANFATKDHNKFLSFLKKALGFKLKTKALKEYEDHTDECPHRKANFDVEIAVDSVYKMQEYKTFVLFSGDSDFEYLIKFLRGHGKGAVVFSRTGHVAKELPPASNYYFDIVDFRHEILRIDRRKK